MYVYIKWIVHNRFVSEKFRIATNKIETPSSWTPSNCIFDELAIDLVGKLEYKVMNCCL